MQLTNSEWEQAEVILMFLLPFKRCTARFECNNSSPETNYVFFAYNTMYDHMDDVKSKWESGIGISALPCAKYILKVIGKMEKYSKSITPRPYFPLFMAMEWFSTPARSSSSLKKNLGQIQVLRNIPMHVINIFFNSMTNPNPILPLLPLRGSPVVQAATNVRRHITMIQNIVKPFPTIYLNDAAMISIATSMIPISHLHLVGGEIIIINTQIREGWSEMCWLCS